MRGDAAQCGEHDGGAADGGEWGVWDVERGLERVPAATTVVLYLTMG